MANEERSLDGYQALTEDSQPSQQSARHPSFAYSLAIGSAAAAVVGIYCYSFFYFLLSDHSLPSPPPTEPVRHYLWGQELLPHEFLALSVIPALVAFVVVTLLDFCWNYAKA